MASKLTCQIASTAGHEPVLIAQALVRIGVRYRRRLQWKNRVTNSRVEGGGGKGK